MQTWITQLLATVVGGLLTLSGTILTLSWQSRRASTEDLRKRSLDATARAISAVIELRAFQLRPTDKEQRTSWENSVSQLTRQIHTAASFILDAELRSRMRRCADTFTYADILKSVAHSKSIRMLVINDLEECLGAYQRSEPLGPRSDSLVVIEIALAQLQVSRTRHPSNAMIVEEYDPIAISRIFGYRPRVSIHERDQPKLSLNESELLNLLGD